MLITNGKAQVSQGSSALTVVSPPVSAPISAPTVVSPPVSLSQPSSVLQTSPVIHGGSSDPLLPSPRALTPSPLPEQQQPSGSRSPDRSPSPESPLPESPLPESLSALQETPHQRYDEIDRLRSLQFEDRDSLDLHSSQSIISSQQTITNGQHAVSEGSAPVIGNHMDGIDSHETNSREFLYIRDLQKRTKRFNAYKSRMNRLLNHIGSRTGCYGIVYLRRSSSALSKLTTGQRMTQGCALLHKLKPSMLPRRLRIILHSMELCGLKWEKSWIWRTANVIFNNSGTAWILIA